MLMTVIYVQFVWDVGVCERREIEKQVSAILHSSYNDFTHSYTTTDVLFIIAMDCNGGLSGSIGL